MRKPEYSSLGVQPFSPISNKKQIFEVLVTSQFNKDKSTIKVDKGQKMTGVTRTSTPKNKVSQDCTIELSPIQNSVQTPICSSTRNTQHHDWVKLNRKFSNCATWNMLEATVKNEMDRLPSLPDCFAGDGDQVDKGARKDIPSDILQRFNVHYPICIVPDGNCFCRSISRLVYGSEHHHVEMRCRIVIDSAEFEQLYRL